VETTSIQFEPTEANSALVATSRSVPCLVGATTDKAHQRNWIAAVCEVIGSQGVLKLYFRPVETYTHTHAMVDLWSCALMEKSENKALLP